LRVLHFYKTAQPTSKGGIEQVIDQLAVSLKKLGVRSDVLSLARGQEAVDFDFGTYKSYRSRMIGEIASTGFSVSVMKRFLELAESADVIHYHFPWPFMDLVHFLCKVKKPTIVTYHSDIVRQRLLLRMYRPLRDAFLKSVDCIVATSPNYLATSDVLNNFREKVSVIPIGLDQDDYPQPDNQRIEYWRSKFPGKFFLFVGVMRYYKGLEILIDSCKRIDRQVVIVGTGPIERELRRRAVSAGLSNVHFLGFLNEVDKVCLLMLCHAIVFPSNLRSEAFGVSLLEGAMFGKPLISSEIGTGTSYINRDGETGIVVPPGNCEALSEAMTILHDNTALSCRMGEAAKRRFEKHFTAKKMAGAYLTLYEELRQARGRMTT
jgi:glycosyltransferase involved in cell wall biosynthesis